VQSAAFLSAEASYLKSLTGDPAFTSLVLQIATDTAALDGFTSAAGQLATLQPTGSAAIEAAKSVINQLPSDAAAFYNSVLSADISIASSVVNNGKGGGSGAAATSGSGSSGSAGSTLSTRSVSGGSGASSTGGATAQTQSGSGAAPTNAVVKAGGVALAMFGAAVALL
jgi:hypothetical protein